MPISRREFESGELDPGLLLIEFLRSNSDYAYTLDELVRELGSKGIHMTGEDLRNILRSLEHRGRIESKIKYGVVYYIYRKTIGFRPS
jgi:acetate kinase